jgi:hypothetical protein
MPNSCALSTPTSRPKLRELHKSSSNEKEGREANEQLVLKGAENEGNLAMEKTNNSLNSLNSIGGVKGEEPEKKGEEPEGDSDSCKDSVIEVTSTGSKGDSSNEVESNGDKERKKEMENQKFKKKGMLANCKERTGASSPSPSVG